MQHAQIVRLIRDGAIAVKDGVEARFAVEEDDAPEDDIGIAALQHGAGADGDKVAQVGRGVRGKAGGMHHDIARHVFLAGVYLIYACCVGKGLIHQQGVGAVRQIEIVVFAGLQVVVYKLYVCLAYIYAVAAAVDFIAIETALCEHEFAVGICIDAAAIAGGKVFGNKYVVKHEFAPVCIDAAAVGVLSGIALQVNSRHIAGHVYIVQGYRNIGRAVHRKSRARHFCRYADRAARYPGGVAGNKRLDLRFDGCAEADGCTHVVAGGAIDKYPSAAGFRRIVADFRAGEIDLTVQSPRVCSRGVPVAEIDKYAAALIACGVVVDAAIIKDRLYVLLPSRPMGHVHTAALIGGIIVNLKIRTIKLDGKIALSLGP